MPNDDKYALNVCFCAKINQRLIMMIGRGSCKNIPYKLPYRASARRFDKIM